MKQLLSSIFLVLMLFVSNAAAQIPEVSDPACAECGVMYHKSGSGWHLDPWEHKSNCPYYEPEPISEPEPVSKPVPQKGTPQKETYITDPSYQNNAIGLLQMTEQRRHQLMQNDASYFERKKIIDDAFQERIFSNIGISARNGKQVYRYAKNKVLKVPNLVYDKCRESEIYNVALSEKVVAVKGTLKETGLYAWYIVNYHFREDYYKSEKSVVETFVHNKNPFEDVSFFPMGFYEFEVFARTKIDKLPILVKQNGKWGIINTNCTKWLLSPTFDDSDIKDLRINVFEDDTPYLRTHNHKLSDINYDPLTFNYYDFESGKVVYKDYPEILHVSLINNGKLIDLDNGKCGTVDLNYNQLIPCIYDEIREAFFPGYPVEWLYSTRLGDYYGIVDRYNKTIVPCECQVGMTLDKNGIVVSKNDYYGMYDYEGNILIPFETFKDIKLLRNDLYVVKSNNYSEGIVTKNGEIIVPCKYADIDFISTSKSSYIIMKSYENFDYAAYVFENNKIGKQVCDFDYSREEIERFLKNR